MSRKKGVEYTFMHLDDHYKVGKKGPLGGEVAGRTFCQTRNLPNQKVGRFTSKLVKEGKKEKDPISNGACEGQKSRSGNLSPLSDP